MSKKKIITIISILYWGILIYSTLSGVLTELAEEGITLTNLSYIETLPKEELMGFFGFIILLFIMCFFVSMVEHLFFTIIYLGGVVAIKQFYNEKTDITDKKNDKYYRNQLQEQSVAVLGYIKDFSTDTNDLTATILSLQLKNKLKIENKKITVINNNIEGLDNNEIYVLESLDKNIPIDLVSFSNKVLEDCHKNNLLEDKGNSKKQLIKKVILSILFIVIINIISVVAPILMTLLSKDPSSILTMIFLIIIFGCFMLDFIAPFIIIPRIVVYNMANKANPYVRSKTAQEVNDKLNGLEHFLKDFTIIKDRTSKEIDLWQEYLIYSIIFNQNDDVSKELMSNLISKNNK